MILRSHVWDCQFLGTLEPPGVGGGGGGGRRRPAWGRPPTMRQQPAEYWVLTVAPGNAVCGRVRKPSGAEIGFRRCGGGGGVCFGRACGCSGGSANQRSRGRVTATSSRHGQEELRIRRSGLWRGPALRRLLPGAVANKYYCRRRQEEVCQGVGTPSCGPALLPDMGRKVSPLPPNPGARESHEAGPGATRRARRNFRRKGHFCSISPYIKN